MFDAKRLLGETRLVKSRSVPEIDDFAVLASEILLELPDFSSRIRRRLLDRAIGLPQSDEDLMLAVVLALILADIATQMSSYVRRVNSDKVRALADRHALSFPALILVSGCCEGIVEEELRTARGHGSTVEGRGL
jgi:hypothetical protein